jgi:hypothetical protein
MKYIVFALSLLAVANSFTLDGPHGDGRFLAHPTISTLTPCPAGEFNQLEEDESGGILNHDGSTYVLNCKPCSKATLAAGGFGYTSVVSGLASPLDVLNRPKCCFNYDNSVCIEQMRAYKQGCDASGTFASGTNDQGHGVGSVCNA